MEYLPVKTFRTDSTVSVGWASEEQNDPKSQRQQIRFAQILFFVARQRVIRIYSRFFIFTSVFFISPRLLLRSLLSSPEKREGQEPFILVDADLDCRLGLPMRCCGNKAAHAHGRPRSAFCSLHHGPGPKPASGRSNQSPRPLPT